MFARFRTSSTRRSAARDAPSGPEADRYLTDGINLYRVVDALRAAPGRVIVGVEDCHSLELILVRAEELRALGLRPVRPAGAT
jgi:hypothetical protein